LQDYYDEIPDLVDSFIESYQGKYGIITNYKSFASTDYKSNEQVVSYLRNISNEIKSIYDSIKDSFLQNQLDTIEELINSTIYKLRFLK